MHTGFDMHTGLAARSSIGECPRKFVSVALVWPLPSDHDLLGFSVVCMSPGMGSVLSAWKHPGWKGGDRELRLILVNKDSKLALVALFSKVFFSILLSAWALLTLVAPSI